MSYSIALINRALKFLFAEVVIRLSFISCLGSLWSDLERKIIIQPKAL